MNAGGPDIPAIGYVGDLPVLLKGDPGFTFKSSTPVKISAGEDNAEVYLTERVSAGIYLYTGLNNARGIVLRRKRQAILRCRDQRQDDA